jgi:hypothetical protein
MRSELVFRANDKVANRFELCRLASSSARTMVRSSVGMHLTINQAFEAIGGQPSPSREGVSAVNLLNVALPSSSITPHTEAAASEPLGMYIPAV